MAEAPPSRYLLNSRYVCRGVIPISPAAARTVNLLLSSRARTSRRFSSRLLITTMPIEMTASKLPKRAETDISTLLSADILALLLHKSFADLKQLYSKSKEWAGFTLEQITEQTKGQDIPRLTMTTVKRHFSALRVFFTHLKRRGEDAGGNRATCF